MGIGGVPINQQLNPYGQYLARKTVTFSNTTGTVSLFTVTGDVLLQLVMVCATSLTSAGTSSLSIGIAAATDAFQSMGDVTTVDAGVVSDMSNGFPAASPHVAALTPIPYVLVGQDIIATLSAQVDSGVLNFYCLWTPLSSDGAVVAA